MCFNDYNGLVIARAYLNALARVIIHARAIQMVFYYGRIYSDSLEYARNRAEQGLTNTRWHIRIANRKILGGGTRSYFYFATPAGGDFLADAIVTTVHFQRKSTSIVGDIIIQAYITLHQKNLFDTGRYRYNIFALDLGALRSLNLREYKEGGNRQHSNDADDQQYFYETEPFIPDSDHKQSP